MQMLTVLPGPASQHLYVIALASGHCSW